MKWEEVVELIIGGVIGIFILFYIFLLPSLITLLIEEWNAREKK